MYVGSYIDMVGEVTESACVRWHFLFVRFLCVMCYCAAVWYTLILSTGCSFQKNNCVEYFLI